MLARSLLALVLVGVTGLIGWRVLRPAELLSTGAAPPSDSAPPGVTGRMSVVPLLVGGRFRVFVSPRQVRADGPVSAKTVRTPFWSLRRWPASVNGVVATGTTVVTRWSDGQVIALDGLTGKIRWRLRVPSSGGFTDARSILWTPPDLYAAGGVAMVRADGQVRALSSLTGATLWSRPCSGAAFATADQLACGDVLLSAVSGEPVAGATGPFTGVTCGVGCLGARNASGQVWPSSLVPPSGSTVVLGSAGGVSYELTAARHLLARDIATGAARQEFPLAFPHDATDWTPRGWQLADGYLAIDRGPAFTRDRVLLAKLP